MARAMTRETYVIGPSSMAVRPLVAGAADGVDGPFVALVPALDLMQLPATLQVVIPLLRAGCADLILAGPRAEAFQDQVGLVIVQQGIAIEPSAYAEVGDACHAALLGALVRKAGIALCADEPEMVAMLRGIAEASGWTKQDATLEAAQAKPQPAAANGKRRSAAAVKPKAAKPKAKATSKPNPKPKPKPKRAKSGEPRARR